MVQQILLMFPILVVVLRFLMAFLLPKRFRLWLNRPVRALLMAWRFNVPYRYAFIVLFITDMQLYSELADEERGRLALLVRQHYPELYTHSIEVFQRGFLKDH